MSDSTMTTLSKMILSFDDQRIEKFYQNIINANPKFKADYVDRVVGVLIKLERLFQHHAELEDFYFKLQEQRNKAEQHYKSWSKNSQYGKSLDQLLDSDPEIKKVFSKLMDITVSNKYLDQEGVDFLIKAEKTLDEKLSELHQKQISLDQKYINNTWHNHRRLAKVLTDLAHRLPVNQDKTQFRVCEKAAEKIVFKLCEEFRGSFRPTPSGFHYIRSDDFIHLGVERACLFFPTDQHQYVKSFISEVLTDLYHEFEEFYSTFHGTQTEINQTFEQREVNAEKLHDKLSQLKDLVSEYANSLDRFSHREEVKTYADKEKLPQTPKPPPSLRRG